MRRQHTLLALLLPLALTRVASADIDLKFAGLVSSDIRYRLGGLLVDPTFPSQYKLLPEGFSRNENRIRSKLQLTVGEKIQAVADVELVYYGFSDATTIDSETLRDHVDPYFIEANAAYIDIYKLLPGLDLRIGRQIVHWGASDQFNPTNNLNTLDLSDPLLFGRALANNMIRADWNPKGDWVFTAVWVPIFRPAQLPRTAPLALKQLDRPAPLQDVRVIGSLQQLEAFANGLDPLQRIDVSSLQPELTLANSQVGLRLGGHVLDQDVSISYYHGRFGIPTPAWSILQSGGVITAGVVWPRMDVLGADIAGSISKLGGVGYWVEGAVTFPQEVRYAIYCDDPKLGCNHFPVQFDPKGNYHEDGTGTRPLVIPTQPFLKLTVGADYSIGEHVYFNLQYLHGFIDEFGAGVQARLPNADDQRNGAIRVEQRLGDYVVAGADFKFFGGTLVARLFGLLKLPSLDLAGHYAGYSPTKPTSGDQTISHWDDYRGTGVLFPQLIWQVWDGTELTAGAFIFLGDRSTKFGDPEVGATEIFLKGKFTF